MVPGREFFWGYSLGQTIIYDLLDILPKIKCSIYNINQVKLGCDELSRQGDVFKLKLVLIVPFPPTLCDADAASKREN